MNTLPDMQEWINRRRLSAKFYEKVLNNTTEKKG